MTVQDKTFKFCQKLWSAYESVSGPTIPQEHVHLYENLKTHHKFEELRLIGPPLELIDRFQGLVDQLASLNGDGSLFVDTIVQYVTKIQPNQIDGGKEEDAVTMYHQTRQFIVSEWWYTVKYYDSFVQYVSVMAALLQWGCTEKDIAPKYVAFICTYGTLVSAMMFNFRDTEDMSEYVSRGRSLVKHMCLVAIELFPPIRLNILLTSKLTAPAVLLEDIWQRELSIEERFEDVLGSESTAAFCITRDLVLRSRLKVVSMNEFKTDLVPILDEDSIKIARRCIYQFIQAEIDAAKSGKLVRWDNSKRLVCAHVTKTVKRPDSKDIEWAKTNAYKLTTQGYPVDAKLECWGLLSLAVVVTLGTYILLWTSPVTINGVTVDPNSTFQSLALVFGGLLTVYQSIRTAHWSWKDFVSGRRFLMESDMGAKTKERLAAIIRVINNDSSHFSSLFSRSDASYAVFDRRGEFKLAAKITEEIMEMAGFIQVADVTHNYFVDVWKLDANEVQLHKATTLKPHKTFQIEFRPSTSRRPIKEGKIGSYETIGDFGE
ncbi:hypothetical protein HDU82_006972 [Entophlyctis luteolus]|nr:hypothetical protein HDU82_006972 [Entophlyctis luteolus]